MLSAGRDFALIKDERSIIPHINQTKRTRNTSVSSARGLLLAEVIGNYLSPLRTAFLLWERVNRSLRVLKPPITGGCLIRGGGEGRTRSLPLLPLSTPPPPPPPTTHRLLNAGRGEETLYRAPLPSRVPIERVVIFFFAWRVKKEERLLLVYFISFCPQIHIVRTYVKLGRLKWSNCVHMAFKWFANNMYHAQDDHVNIVRWADCIKILKFP